MCRLGQGGVDVAEGWTILLIGRSPCAAGFRQW